MQNNVQKDITSASSVVAASREFEAQPAATFPPPPGNEAIPQQTQDLDIIHPSRSALIGQPNPRKCPGSESHPVPDPPEGKRICVSDEEAEWNIEEASTPRFKKKTKMAYPKTSAAVEEGKNEPAQKR
ncbi:hypothetical protein K469DRAFT_306884 [Zopfia rhizophila CBS 207.26]|uniref:Uncharacterized protein n=1 Tax=Zopfia rhizophila CBS 207.26 TaxID=1314779 RepID=A0A6A6ENA0_9PEZI|nr:hypothetical protein K469DRAFT_306884 [Zopfia rhizophila CBS 207.26]